MSNELATVGQQALAKPALPAGGIGFDTGSKIFKVKPQTIELVQSMTKQEEAIPGKFRNTGTKAHFDELHVVLMLTPQEQRQYMQPGDFTADAKLCFSTDGIKPHELAKAPQAMVCARCPKGSWDRYEAAKKRGEKDLSKYKPECDLYYHVTFMDRLTRSPFYFNFRKTAMKPFTNAMQVIASMAAVLRANNENPNIFDFSFKIKPKKESGKSYWTVAFSEFARMSEDDRAAFGGVYADYVASRQQRQRDEVDQAEEGSLDDAVNEAPAQSATAGEPITI